MPDLPALLDALRERLDDEGRWLALAGWLRDNDRDDEAAVVRVFWPTLRDNVLDWCRSNRRCGNWPVTRAGWGGGPGRLKGGGGTARPTSRCPLAPAGSPYQNRDMSRERLDYTDPESGRQRRRPFFRMAVLVVFLQVAYVGTYAALLRPVEFGGGGLHRWSSCRIPT
jgi:hypothetical protein